MADPNKAGLPQPPAPPTTPPLFPPTVITSGSGNFVPRLATNWLKVTLLGGGAGGNSSAGSASCVGGLSAIPVTYWVKKTKATYAYAVGAAGLGVYAGSGTSGGDTTFDSLTGYGAQAGGPNPTTLGAPYYGENSPHGRGGSWGPTPGSATGYGAGGGGTNGGSTTGGNGTGGLLIIEEY